MIDNLRGDLIKINKLEDLYKDYYASAFRYLKAKGIYTPGFVWGCGDVDAKVVLIGEAPGRDKVDKSIPFAGKAGGILNEFISCTSCKRDEMFITNTIKYRLSMPRKKTMNPLSPALYRIKILPTDPQPFAKYALPLHI